MREPTPAQVHRVPRSRVDDFYLGGRAGEPLPAVSHGAAVVSSVELDTVTVLIGDDLVSGVIVLGADVAVGDEVTLETRGDLLVIPDWFAEGISGGSGDGLHVVSDADPGTPPDQSINIGGADLDAWYFDPIESPGWTRDVAAGGIRVQRDETALGATSVGMLWSSTVFAVIPSQQITLTMTGVWQDLRSVQAEPVLLLAGQDQANPVVAADGSVVGSAATLVDTPDPGEPVGQTITVPAEVTTPAGAVAPAWSRLGVRLTVAAFLTNTWDAAGTSWDAATAGATWDTWTGPNG